MWANKDFLPAVENKGTRRLAEYDFIRSFAA
jgi:hypothetical protein